MENREYIRIKGVNGGLSIKARFAIVEYIDKDTDMTCLYLPSIDVHAYGDDKEEALIMLNVSIDTLFNDFSDWGVKGIEQELYRLGWSKKKYHQKEFFSNLSIETRLSDAEIENYSISELDFAA